MSERDTFGPRLRRERERRGISLDAIVTRTNVSRELWEGFESSDLSRWPTGLYARAFVRDYAKAVGLDPNEVVDVYHRDMVACGRRSGVRDLVGSVNGVLDLEG